MRLVHTATRELERARERKHQLMRAHNHPGIAAAVLCCLLALTSTASAQLAPAGGVQGGNRGSDAVSPSGGYAASVPLELPAARGGLPVPLAIAAGGSRVGAAGLGWDVPLSYVYRDVTSAHRRPMPQSQFTPGAWPNDSAVDPIVPNKRISVVIGGAAIDLVLNAAGTAWVARRGDAQMELRQLNADTMVMYDGSGRKYNFSSLGPGNTHLFNGNLFLLQSITGAGSNVVRLQYDIHQVALPGVSAAMPAINLTDVRYNAHPTAQDCFRSQIVLGYDSPASTLLATAVLGSQLLVRNQKLVSVTVESRATCGDQGTVLRSYALTYAPDVDTGAPRLQSVTMTGREGTPEQNIALPIVSYSYGSIRDGAAISYQITAASPLSLSYSHPMLSYSTTTFGANTQTVTKSGDLLDLTGDGRPDLLESGGARVNGPGPNATTVFSIPSSFFFFFHPKTVTKPIGKMYANVPKVSDVLSEYIDFNGDGRVDFLDASGDANIWTLYLNTPDPDSPSYPKWKKFDLSTARIRQALQAQGFGDIAEHTPLARKRSIPDAIYNHCFQWNASTKKWNIEPGQWATDAVGSTPCEVVYHTQHDDPSIPKYGSDPGVERTVVEWDLKDINGDGYPDFIYNRMPAIPGYDSIIPNGPAAPGTYDGELALVPFVSPTPPDFEAFMMINTTGVHITVGDVVFSSPVSLFGENDDCGGIERWAAPPGATLPDEMELVCGLQDVNGDGLLDRVLTYFQPDNSRVVKAFLGTGDSQNPFLWLMAGVILPGPPARTSVSLVADGTGGYRPSACTTPSSRFVTRMTRGLRDINGDGIPDYITDEGLGMKVALGTGTGYSAPIAVSAPSGVHLAMESHICDPNAGFLTSGTTNVLYDLDGDGQPEAVVYNESASKFDVYHLSSSAQQTEVGITADIPQAGRLIAISNGYGATTRIEYKSAKEDTKTPHQIPGSEIVVAAVATFGPGSQRLSATTFYAYGNASLIFDSAHDRFQSTGYSRTVAMWHTAGDAATGSRATITDAYGLTPFASGMPAQERLKRYLKVGRGRDVSQLQGTFTSAWELLATDVTSNSSGRFSGQHLDWEARRLPPGAATSGNEVCLDMVDPYDLAASQAQSLNSDACTERGFLYLSSEVAWRGQANNGVLVPPPSNSVIATDTEVTEVDDLGRTTKLSLLNDSARSDDNVCVTMTYAAPTQAGPHVLNAVASKTTTNCGTPTAITLNHETWEYDALPSGVASGFVTGKTVSRLDEAGQPITNAIGSSEIRTFTAGYDAMGNVTSLGSVREDGALRVASLSYDPFAMATISVTTQAVSLAIDATPTLPTTVTTSRDPVTLAVLSVTDPNGMQRGITYDGFGRVLLSEVAPPGGSLGALSSMTYLGFASGDTSGRRIVQKAFTDPVAPGSVGTAAGRTSTIFLDVLGRTQRGEVALGSDYGNQTLTVGQRTYDLLGRVLFEADPFPSTQSFATAYGTSHYYLPIGLPACFVRGNGLQPEPIAGAPNFPITDESQERYQTCFFADVSEGTWRTGVADASSYLSQAPQQNVVRYMTRTAAGRAIRSWTDQGANHLERVDYTHDALGRMTGQTRYRDVFAGAPVTTSWHYDSLGQLIELDEPDSAPQFRSYDDWGELTQVQWLDSTGGTPTDRRSLSQYDALGRLVHREDRTDGDVDPRTVNDYAFDIGVNTALPAVTATYTLGRLAQATSATSAMAFSYAPLGELAAEVYTDLTATSNNVFVAKHTEHGDGTTAALDLLLPDTGYGVEHVAYTYDSAGRGREATYTAAGTTRTLFSATGASAIDAFGRIRNAQYGATGYTASFADTGRRLIQDLKVISPVVGSREISFAVPSDLSALGAAFDPMGRERVRQELKDGVAQPARYNEYDALGQLQFAKVVGVPTEREFSYDALGNLLQQKNNVDPSASVAMSYQTGSHDLDRICSIAWGSATPPALCNVHYDGAGNITQEPSRSDGVRTFSYFPSGRVSDIASSTATAMYDYDAFGSVQRLTLTSSASQDQRHDKHFGTLFEIRDEKVGGTPQPVIVRTIPGPGGMLASRHGATANATWTFTFGEARGSRFVTDQDGQFVQDVDYQPFGEVRSQAGAQPGSALYTTAQWNGGDALGAFGLSQLGARIYDPVIGRFLSRDPLMMTGAASASNPYAFAANDPINKSDPSGLCFLLDRPDCAETHPEDIGGNWSAPSSVAGSGPASAEGGASGHRPPPRPPSPPTGPSLPPIAPGAGFSWLGIGGLPTSAVISEATAAAETLAPTAEFGLYEGGAVIAGEVAAAAEGVSTAIGLASLAGVAAGLALPVAAGAVLYYRPEWAVDLACAEDPTICVERDIEDAKERHAREINLDTSSIIAATQTRDPWLATGVNMFLADKDVVVTDTALREFAVIVGKYATPEETMRAAAFMMRVKRIPDDTYADIPGLPNGPDLRNDNVIFVTGYKRGIPTLTGDTTAANRMRDFIKDINIVTHRHARYSGGPTK